MSIKIERLDSEDSERDITLLLGKNIILKLYPKNSIYDSNQEIKNLINHNDLLNGEKIEKIKKLTILNDSRISLIDTLKQRKDMLIDFAKRNKNDANTDKLIKDFLKDQIESFEDYFQKIKDISAEIDSINQFFNVNLTEKKTICFCNNCHTIIKEGGLLGPEGCNLCGNKVTRSSNQEFHVLKNEIAYYLKGNWFADYLAKLLRKIGWKTWTNLYILGNSGIPHEIDILAISPNGGFILLAECKTGNPSREEIFTLSTKSNDIRSTFCFLYTLSEIKERDSKHFMEKTRIEYIENAIQKKDEDILKEINSKIGNISK